MKVKILISLLGLLVGASLYWTRPYGDVNFSNVQLWAFVGAGSLIGSFCAVLLSNERPFKVALLIVLGLILAIILRIFYDTVFWDKTSHNLAPFEILFGIVQSLPFSVIGAYVAQLVKRIKHGKQPSN